MNHNEANELMRALAANYHHTEVSEDMATMWIAKFESIAEYEMGLKAVERWISSYKWWPTIAEWDQMVQLMGRDFMMIRRLQASQCPGSGWVKRGDELRPCPTCSPYLASVWGDSKKMAMWREGVQLHVIAQIEWRIFQDDWGRPPCIPIPDDADPETDARAGRQATIEAFRRGYIQSRTEAGDDLEAIEPKLKSHLRRWFGDRAIVPSS